MAAMIALAPLVYVQPGIIPLLVCAAGIVVCVGGLRDDHNG
jgi:hypothetical protein